MKYSRVWDHSVATIYVNATCTEFIGEVTSSFLKEKWTSTENGISLLVDQMGKVQIRIEEQAEDFKYRFLAVIVYFISYCVCFSEIY